MRALFYAIFVYRAFLAFYHSEIPFNKQSRNVVIALSPVIVQAAMMTQSTKINDMLTEFVRMMTYEQSLKIKKYSFYILLGYFSGIGLIYNSFTGQAYSPQEAKSCIAWNYEDFRWYHLLLVILMRSVNQVLFSTQWTYVALTTYCLTLMCWSLANSQLNRAVIKLGNLNDEHCSTLVQMKRHMNSLKEQFNEVFGIIPLSSTQNLEVDKLKDEYDNMMQGREELILDLQVKNEENQALMKQVEEKEATNALMASEWQKAVAGNQVLLGQIQYLKSRSTTGSIAAFDFRYKGSSSPKLQMADNVIVQAALMTQSTKINHMLTEFVRMMTIEQNLKIKKYSLYILIGYVAALGLAYNSFTAQSYSSQEAKSGIAWSYEDFRWYHLLLVILTRNVNQVLFSTQWIYMGLSSYCITLLCWSFANSQLNRAVIKLGNLNDGHCSKLVQMKQHMNHLKERFNEVFGIVPLVCLGSLFVESTGVILLISYEGFGDERNWLLVGLYTLNTVLCLINLVIVRKVQRQEQEEHGQVFKNWWHNSVEIKNGELKYTFKKVFGPTVPLSAILFKLDETIILGYAGSLITFTVMFIQLQGCNNKKASYLISQQTNSVIVQTEAIAIANILQMDADVVFQHVDTLLTIFGCRIFASCRWQRVSNLAMRGLFYTLVTLRLVYACEIYVTLPSSELARLVVILLAPVMLQMAIMWKNTQIRKLIKELISSMSQEQRSKVKMYSTAIPVIFMSVIAIILGLHHFGMMSCTENVPLTLTKWIRDNVQRSEHIVFAIAAPYEVLYAYLWITAGLGTYAVVISCWSAANSATNQLAISQGQLSDDKCLSLISKKRSINELKCQAQ
ncbi:hypothetical protein HDE_11621 [Halotydeus destructor]|nr:hypothetical protein HDE_11621 [Halotydeus destructor]